MTKIRYTFVLKDPINATLNWNTEGLILDSFERVLGGSAYYARGKLRRLKLGFQPKTGTVGHSEGHAVFKL
jgi:hypothetical protein